jgi:YHS domain-containing protein
MFKKISVIFITGIFIFGISRLSFAMMCGSSEERHSSHQQMAQVHTEHERGTTGAVKEAVPEESINVGNKICPVLGEKINEKMKATYEYEGKIYNFCCPMCIDEFKKDPQKYIKKVNEELQAESKKETKKDKIIMSEPRISGGIHEGHQH